MRFRIGIAAGLCVAIGAAGWWLMQGGTKPAADASAVPIVSQCPPLKGPRWVFPAHVRDSSDLYESYTISYPCTEAARYIVLFARRTLANRVSGVENELATGGPPGFRCVAYPDRNGHAYAGSCRQGNSAFGWNWNVQYRATTLGPSGETQQTSTSEYSLVLEPLGHGTYRLILGNTSGIGFINDFRWTPPTGLTISSVTHTTHGRCQLTSGSLSCSGNLQPPKCLCGPAGGSLTVDFTATESRPAETNGHSVAYGFVGGHLRITAMTPIPYFIPNTPQEEHSHQGV